jgi:hypothetical protein
MSRPRVITYPSPAEYAIAADTDERKEDHKRGTIWPEHEKAWLWLHYGRFPMKFIADTLRRTPLACRVQICRMKRQRTDRKPDLGNVSRLTPATHLPVAVS